MSHNHRWDQHLIERFFRSFFSVADFASEQLWNINQDEVAASISDEFRTYRLFALNISL